MIHLLGNYTGTRSTEDGQEISFLIDDVPAEELAALADKELTIDVSELKKKRSLNANAYFWKLVSMIAGAMRSDKDSIYLMLLQRYGQFETIEVIEEALPALKRHFVYLEIVDERITEHFGKEIKLTTVNCYYGTSSYTSTEFAKLVEGTISEAAELHLPTITPKELELIKQNWRSK